MKRTISFLIASALSASLLAGTAAAAFLSNALVGDKGQIMMDVKSYAGSGDYGSANDMRLQAEFRHPSGLLVRGDGALIVADGDNHLLRAVTADGTESLAGVLLKKDAQGKLVGGLLDGPSNASLFQNPSGIAADAQGRLYVADTENHAIRKIGLDGSVTTIAGTGLLGRLDGPGSRATFHSPKDVAVAADGTVYVADTLNHVIRKITPAGEVVTLTAPSNRVVEAFPGVAVPAGDFADGDMAIAKFNEPSGLALDARGNLYVSDSGNHSIRYINFQSGKVTTVAGSAMRIGKGKSLYADLTRLYAEDGFADGKASDAAFRYPAGIAVTEEGGLVIADSLNHSIRYLQDGEVATLAGHSSQLSGEHDGADRLATFHRPTDVAIAPDGSIYVADSYNNKIRLLTPYRLPDLPEAPALKVVIGSGLVAFDAQPEMISSRVMVPVRAVAERLGYEVEYEDGEKLVTFTGADGSVLELRIDANSPYAPYLKQGRTYVPVRFMAEQLGLDVQWQQESRTVILRP
ncbi:stalk domain-containing protein [Paenibacillus sp. SCIV0701]|uniref:Stalk domain-containing protein n=1 Tax=Paenibacillus soyae TaxID=2969249 RepID=A0A9X2SA49_9BACL|nr:stalk domain-containing protein [Paenibacillus soyae]MCR2805715.1 stalk domain-containing protein [Paenibacillus soyae]